jgi:Ca-activated chloride channel family protein
MRGCPIGLVPAIVVAALPALTFAGGQETVFKAGVDVVTVPATVTDRDGRFITGLTRDDFVVSDDGKPQEIITFSSERVPVSLGILLDVSGSMTEDRMATARLAINHFAFSLLRPDDELFLTEFAGTGRMLVPWTTDREAFTRALAGARMTPLPPVGSTGISGNWGTAVFDAVDTSLGFAAEGVHPKKAVLVISDGIDTSSRRSSSDVQKAIRASGILVYALAVDASDEPGPFGVVDDGVDARALRGLTDDTGGRTEVVKGFAKLAESTARLADEFNRQYVIGYAAPASRDGRWHSIKVEVRRRGATVRARAGYVAS